MSYLKDREIWLSNVPTGNPPAGYFWKFIQNGKVVVRDSSGNNQIMVATSGSQAITGSLTVTGGITGTATTASYVEYSNVANKPALVSGSAQIAAFGYATTSSNGFNGSQSITGSLTVTGQVVAQTLNVQQVTSSIVYSSGSNIFGNSLANTQQFTGSMGVTGSLTVAGTTTANGISSIGREQAFTWQRTTGTASDVYSLNADSGAAYIYNNTTANVLMSWLEGGNVGIGTTSPGLRLHVSTTAAEVLRLQGTSGGSTNNTQLRFFGSNANTDLWAIGTEVSTGSTDRAFDFYDLVAGANRMRITSGGNVLIGTTTDNGARLQVSGTATILGPTATIGNAVAATNVKLIFNGVANKAAGIEFQQSGTPQWYIGNGIASEDNNFELYNSNGTMAMKIIKSTNAINFIGAATFSSSITSTLSSGIFLSNSSGGTNATQLRISNTSGDLRLGIESSTGGTIQIGTLAYAAVFGNQANNPVQFTTNGTARMTITSSGNVGIGTSSPEQILHVDGNTIVGAGTPNDFGQRFLQIRGSRGSSGVPAATLFLSQIWNGVSYPAIVEAQQGTIYGNAAADLVFKTSFFSGGVNTVERMRITDGGNVGIGIASPSQRLHVVGNAIFNNSSFGTANIRLIGVGTSTGFDILADSNDGSLWNRDSGNIYFGTGGIERMRITSTGRTLLLGSTSSGWSDANRALLELNHTGSALLGLRINGDQRAYFYHNNSHLYIENMLAGASIYVISNSGGVYLTSGGTSWTSNSDERLKNINGEIENAVNKLSQLRAVNFSWKNNAVEKQNLGLIAQDVEKVFPELIDKNKLPSKANETQQDETEYLGVRYQELIPVLVKAIQEQQTLIESLKSRIEILEQ